MNDFDRAGRRGDSYESFGVNWRNSNGLSKGTRARMAGFNRLIAQCVAGSRRGNRRETLEAFEICFALLPRIDECGDEILFFADEGGSWQVGVNWRLVVPAWCRQGKPSLGCWSEACLLNYEFVGD